MEQPTNPIAGFFKGLGHYFRGILFFITHPQLWKLAVIPGVISLLLLYGLLYLQDVSYAKVAHLLSANALISKLFSWLKGVLNFLIFVTFSIFGMFLYYIVINIITGVFLNKLSCKIEEIKTGQVIYNKVSFAKGLLQTLGKIKSLLIYGVIALLLLLINLIPIVGQVITLLVVSYYTGKSYTEHVLARRKISNAQRKKSFKGQMTTLIAFGLICLAALSLPQVLSAKLCTTMLHKRLILAISILVVPINVTAGTLLALGKVKQ